MEVKATVPCSRCRVKKTGCHWKPSNRTGRPRKNPPKSPRNKSKESQISGGQSDKSTSPTLPSPSTSSSSRLQLPPLPVPLTSGVGYQESQSQFNVVPDPPAIPSPSRYQERYLAYDSPSHFSAQANLLSQQGSLDGTMDAGALDEALYSMWPEEYSYNQWSHSSSSHPQDDLEILSHHSASDAAPITSNPLSGIIGSSTHQNSQSPRPLNVMYDSVGAGPSNSPSARDQFEQLSAFAGRTGSSSSIQSTSVSNTVSLGREIVNLGHESHLSRSLQEG